MSRRVSKSFWVRDSGLSRVVLGEICEYLWVKGSSCMKLPSSGVVLDADMVKEVVEILFIGFD